MVLCSKSGASGRSVTKNAEYFKLIEYFTNDYQKSNGITPTICEIESDLSIPKATVGR